MVQATILCAESCGWAGDSAPPDATGEKRGGEARGSVYVIQCQETGRVKIGFSERPAARLATFQLGSPTELALVREIPGATRDDEKALQDRCARHWLRGEWFTPDALEVLT